LFDVQQADAADWGHYNYMYLFRAFFRKLGHVLIYYLHDI